MKPFKAPKFPVADYYECSDYLESYSHTDPGEAIVDNYGSDWEDVIKEGLTIYCYRYQAVPKTVGKSLAQNVIELISDELMELQDPDGGAFETAAVQALMPVLEATIQAVAESMTVWSCEEFAKVELTGEQVAHVLRGGKVVIGD